MAEEKEKKVDEKGREQGNKVKGTVPNGQLSREKEIPERIRILLCLCVLLI